MSPHDPSIGDCNLGRLLRVSYQPENPDPAFVAELQERLRDAALQHAARQSADIRVRRLRVRLGWVMTVAAAVALVGLFFYARRPLPPTSGVGPIFRSQEHETSLAGSEHLIAREMVQTKKDETLDAGKSVTTEAGQRRRLALPDGSLVYLNEKTTVCLEVRRRLTLEKGEVFVEVAPKAGEPFIVNAPDRQVIALGTKFNVRALAGKTSVMVTQGKVQVSGLEAVLHAGQQLLPNEKEPAPAPLASFLLDWARDLIGAESAPVASNRYGGGALIAFDSAGQEAKITLRNFHLDVHIEDGFARTTIDQTYFNEESTQLEGTFHFPLPADATLSRLAMYVNGTLMEGGMAERDHARNTFEQIRYTRRDPALLEWVDGSTFKMRVFPLEPRQEKRIILSYTQRLAAAYDKTSYRFPMGHDLKFVAQLSAQVRVKDGAKMQWSSPAHEFKATADGRDLLLTAEAKNARLDRDLQLDLIDAREQDNSARFGSYEQDGYRYLMLRYRPDDLRRAGAVMPPVNSPKHYLFLAETSADRDPLLARTQIEIVRTLLENLEHDDTFAILTANTRVKSVAEKLPATAENIAGAVARLEKSHLIGALDLDQALKAVREVLTGEEGAYLVHVGSGVPALGERRDDLLLRRLPAGVHYAGIGVGKRWNRAFMKSAAEQAGGHFAQINPDEPVAWKAFDFLATLHAPRWQRLQVYDEQSVFAGQARYGGCGFFGGINRSADNPHTWFVYDTSVSAGEELCAVLRQKANEPLPKTVTIFGVLNGEAFEKKIPVEAVKSEAGYLPRTWAKLEIDRLLAEESGKNKQAIIDLSKAMYVMSPFTSLLVLETEQMYAQFKVDRGRKDHWAMYACPQKIPVVTESLAKKPQKLSANELRANRLAEKRTTDDVLKTIIVRSRPALFVGPGAQTMWVDFDGAIEGKLGGSFVIAPGSNSPILVSSTPYFAFQAQQQYQENSARQSPGELRAGTPPPVGFSGIGVMGFPGSNFGGANFGGGGFGGSNFAGRGFSGIGGICGGFNCSGNFNGNFQTGFGVGSNLSGGAVNLGFGGGQPGFNATNLGVGGGQLGVQAVNLGFGGGQLGVGGQMGLAGFGGANGFFPVNNSLVAPFGQLGQLGVAGFGGANGSFNWNNSFAAPFGQFGIGGFGGANGNFNINNDRLAPNFQLGFNGLPQNWAGEITNLETDIRRWTLERIPTPSVPGYYPFFNSAAVSLDGSVRAIRDGNSNTLFFVDLPLEHKKPWPVTGNGRFGTDGLLIYQRPAFQDPQAFFRDLLAFAPGMNTSAADIAATLEAEAGVGRATVGQVDPEARKLIEKARSLGWRKVKVGDGPAAFTVLCDGVGRSIYQRTLSVGLKEQVICDGTTLWHLYPELGVGAKRTFSRHHAAELQALVLWLVPPAEELARNADVNLIGSNTIVISPHGKAQTKGQVHLVFAPDGRLRERLVVLMPEKKVLARERFDAKNFGEPAAAPKLTPNTEGLLVLPLPYRTLPETERLFGKKAPVWSGALNLSDDEQVAFLSAAFADASAASTQSASLVINTLEERMALKHPDLIPGLYLLIQLRGTREPQFTGHPPAELVRYLQQVRPGAGNSRGANPDGGFVNRMSALHELHTAWQAGQLPASRKELVARTRDFVERNTHGLGLSLLLLAGSRGDLDQDSWRALAEAWQLFDHNPAFAYTARYERMRCLLNGGMPNTARLAFDEMYRKEMEAGAIPPLDGEVKRLPANDNGPWSAVMVRAAEQFAGKDHLSSVIALAWQCQLLGERDLAQQVFARLGEKLEKAPASVRLLTVQFLAATGRTSEAQDLLSAMLERPQLSKLAGLWRLAGDLAAARRQTRRMVECLERALDLEHAALPEVFDVQAVRADYGALLEGYRQLLDAWRQTETRPPSDFVGRVVKAADRWRQLDPDPTAACQLAARLLRELDEPVLAWDYLTTPIAMRPDESEPLKNLAKELSAANDLALAEKAYAAAFAAEPTDAELLWSRVQLLQRLGRHADAEDGLRKLSEGQWQPRFDWIKREVRQQLER
jgi:ferric-dicitrate binding protein FerR (iron transport regulator)